MNFIRLGNSGLRITELTLGTALTIGTEITGEKKAQALIDTAWDLGIRSFDVSNNYGNGEAEKILGKCLKKYPRQSFVLISKGSWPIGEFPYYQGLSRKHILWAIDESLKRLDMGYVDIYFAHRYDKDVPMREIAKTFNFIIESGKARYWATSEWPLEALQELIQVCDDLNIERPITEQFIYSYAVRKSVTNGVKAFCDKNKMGTMGFSPFCQGYLTGKYRNGIPNDSRIAKKEQINYSKTENFYEQNKERIDYFLAVCEQYHIDSSACALQWCLRQNILPVFGASKATGA